VADLGCGTGRHVLPLAENGYFVLAVDLSLPMLSSLKRKSSAEKQLNPSKIWNVPNFWYQVRHPGGSYWLIANAFRSATGKCELGDRYAAYRGIKKMFIHSFRKMELKEDLRRQVSAR
jgi:hypothetical protein